MLRSRSNCSTTRDEPVRLFEVISLTPEITPSVRSSGVATVRAMSDGLAPAMLADTKITGKSTEGRRDTGNMKNAAMPASAMPSVSSTVAMGRWMKGRDRFTDAPPRPAASLDFQRLLGLQPNHGGRRQLLNPEHPARRCGARGGRTRGRSPAW